MDQGWVKLHRQILDNIFLMNDDNAYIVFTKLLLLVNKRTGQLATGRNQLGEILHMNPRTLYGVLVRLETQQVIEIDSNNRYSVISICKWSEYQSQLNSKEETVATTRQQPRNNAATTRQHSNKKEKENKKEEVVSKLTTASAVEHGKPEINEMFSLWNDVVGYDITSKRQPNRNACSNMLKKHGKDKLSQLVQGVALAQSDQYAPRIADFCDLQAKLNQLIVWGKGRKNNEPAAF